MTRWMVKTGRPVQTAALVVALGLVAGCEDGKQMSFLQPKDKTEQAAAPSKSTELVQRDVEAPDVFQKTEAGLWDGRPSLGGVWVAHPDVGEPERVIIRNNANGKFVIGALFRREREIPGPRFQASSDAAAALGMLAGAPVELNVTALRREAVEEPPKPSEDTVAAVEKTGDVSETPLDPIAGAAAAIDAAPDQPAEKKKFWKKKNKKSTPNPASTTAAMTAAATATATDTATDMGAPAATPAPASAAAPKAVTPKVSPLSKPFIQIGIFNVKKNAERTATQMRSAGMIPTVLAQKSNGKSFWRVLVGPAQSKSERSALLKQVKSAGFSDAYYVTN